MPITIRKRGAQVPASLADRIRSVELPTLGHFLEVGFVDARIRRMTGSGPLVGQAVTVRVVAPDSALVHLATEFLQVGDVLVIDTGGDRRHAPVGAVVAEAVAARGAAGIVIDGPCTDLSALRGLPLSVYARGASALTTKLHALDAGGINLPVSIGGVAVLAGHVVIGADEGLLIADQEDVTAVLDRAEASDAAEREKVERLRAGALLSTVSVAGERLKATMHPQTGKR